MIKIENVDVHGVARAIYSARNAMNSWDKSDSRFETDTMGENDLKLAKQLVKAGTDHSKFMRMITVTCDITAPQFWAAELDTYKIATVRNSCSFQHKGVSKPFSIRDFSVSSEIYDILDPIKEKREHPLVYPHCNSDEFKIHVVGDRNYKVYKNGKVIACAFERVHEKDNRVRHFKEREVIPSKTAAGYYEINIGGRKYLEKWLLHSLVAEVWMSDSYFSGAEINHIDGNKGNNSVNNLEYEYGHPYTKRTCLWLKGLPKLQPTNIVEPIGTYCPSGSYSHKHDQKHKGVFTKDRAKNRSKTFEGIAKAMAEQWSKYLCELPEND